MSFSDPIQLAHQFLEGPVVRPALVWWRLHRFLSPQGYPAYFGVFPSFAAARAWLPHSPGFDHGPLATEYVQVRTQKVFAYDYPVLWWLQHAFRCGAAHVLDIGGSVGVHYFAYRRYLEMPPALTWHVADLPSIVSIGRTLAEQQGISALTFTDDLPLALAGEHDIWISAGALQYFEHGRPSGLLERCAMRPGHLVFNKLPLYEGEDFVTTQNIGEGCYAPLYVYNRARLIHDIEALGYRLRDCWPVHERSLDLPGYPERSLPSFSGLYFDLLHQMPGLNS
ncbi:MAG: putative methyltransferase, family [Variovorax sp.]|nr:putative methyltransferase, family [Variovorax sp.]